jgi:hypothetical protein
MFYTEQCVFFVMFILFFTISLSNRDDGDKIFDEDGAAASFLIAFDSTSFSLKFH